MPKPKADKLLNCRVHILIKVFIIYSFQTKDIATAIITHGIEKQGNDT
jgi:hypothetical protein